MTDLALEQYLVYIHVYNCGEYYKPTSLRKRHLNLYVLEQAKNNFRYK